MKFSSKDRYRFYSDLSKYTRAGFGIDKACESIAGQPGIGAAKQAIFRAVRKLRVALGPLVEENHGTTG